MKKSVYIFFCFLLTASANAQVNVDSLKNVFLRPQPDSTKYRICRSIYDFYEETNKDSAYRYALLSADIAKRNGRKLNEIHSINNIAYQLYGLGKFADALKKVLEAFRMAEDKSNDNVPSWSFFATSFYDSFPGNKRLLMLAYTHHIFGIILWQTGSNEESIAEFTKARDISASIHHPTRQMMATMNLARSYWSAGQFDKAMRLAREAEQLAFRTGYRKYLGQVYYTVARVYEAKKDSERQLQYYHIAADVALKQKNINNLITIYHSISQYYIEHGKQDSALYYGRLNLDAVRQLGTVSGLTVNIGGVYEDIYTAYLLNGPKDSVFKYQGLTLRVKDSLYKIRIKMLTDYQKVTMNEQLRLQNIENEKVVYQNKVRTYFLLTGIVVLLLLAIIFYRNNRQKQKAKQKVEQAYDELKTTQQQLIQSEKMASLGELTAGIAHEIQNPLNFVNNFSDMNVELSQELIEEIDKGNTSEARSIAEDIAANAEKINLHGKRADSIVKGMLQHSRTSAGVKELTDINALCDEYLRLSYHGLRAKEKSFNADFKTDFDNSLPKLNVIPQEIGRVLLNLFNNAFYAANEKKKTNVDFNPVIEVATFKQNNNACIVVKDNGSGIPEKILNKIWQPFFTTKPTGEGTGLGLSLSYDIITKAHGGEMLVVTKEGEGTSMTIKIPIQ